MKFSLLEFCVLFFSCALAKRTIFWMWNRTALDFLVKSNTHLSVQNSFCLCSNNQQNDLLLTRFALRSLYERVRFSTNSIEIRFLQLWCTYVHTYVCRCFSFQFIKKFARLPPKILFIVFQTFFFSIYYQDAFIYAIFPSISRGDNSTAIIRHKPCHSITAAAADFKSCVLFVLTNGTYSPLLHVK